MNIYVGNLSYEVSEDDLKQAFEAFGQVASATIIKDKYTNRSKGFGFVEMPNEAEAKAAPLVFQVAAQGDAAAQQVIRENGQELGEMACGIIRQIDIQELAFEVVLTGSLFKGGQEMIDAMAETIHQLAPKARLVRLDAPPVIGAVLLGMQQAGIDAYKHKHVLLESIKQYLE